MKKTPRLRHSPGFTTIELIMTVAILGILVAILSASYGVMQANGRASRTKGDMDAIAHAGYADYSFNNQWADLTLPAGMPPTFAAEGLLTAWPSPPCPNYSYTWDNWYTAFDIPAVRVTLRRPDQTPLWSYCVDTFGGGNCDAADPVTGGVPIELTTNNVNAFYCTE